MVNDSSSLAVLEDVLVNIIFSKAINVNFTAVYNSPRVDVFQCRRNLNEDPPNRLLFHKSRVTLTAAD